jgi:hypothetical protein
VTRNAATLPPGFRQQAVVTFVAWILAIPFGRIVATPPAGPMTTPLAGVVASPSGLVLRPESWRAPSSSRLVVTSSTWVVLTPVDRVVATLAAVDMKPAIRTARIVVSEMALPGVWV